MKNHSEQKKLFRHVLVSEKSSKYLLPFSIFLFPLDRLLSSELSSSVSRSIRLRLLLISCLIIEKERSGGVPSKTALADIGTLFLLPPLLFRISSPPSHLPLVDVVICRITSRKPILNQISICERPPRNPVHRLPLLPLPPPPQQFPAHKVDPIHLIPVVKVRVGAISFSQSPRTWFRALPVRRPYCHSPFLTLT